MNKVLLTLPILIAMNASAWTSRSSVSAEIISPYLPTIDSVVEVSVKPSIIETPKEESIENQIKEIFPERTKEVIATFKHENGYQLRNGWDTNIVSVNTNGSEDIGITMVNTQNFEWCGGREKMFDVKENLKCSRKIYDYFEKQTGDGLNGWFSYRNNKHLMFM